MSSLQRGENWVRSASRNSRARASALDPTTQSKLPHCYFQFRPCEINADNQGFTVREVVPRISGRMSIPYQSSWWKKSTGRLVRSKRFDTPDKPVTRQVRSTRVPQQNQNISDIVKRLFLSQENSVMVRNADPACLDCMGQEQNFFNVPDSN